MSLRDASNAAPYAPVLWRWRDRVQARLAA
jgi:hypothetical protein